MGTEDVEWDVFISHASEDKSSIAGPLDARLQENGLRVWYDERELKVGASLRESIDQGLRRSRFGVVVLSPSFFGKNWPGNELDGLFALESDGKDRILPVWHEVEFDDVARYSPILAGRIAAKSSDGLEQVVKRILARMSEASGSSSAAHQDRVASSQARPAPIAPNYLLSPTLAPALETRLAAAHRPHASLDLIYASPIHRPLFDTFRALFSGAGWHVPSDGAIPPESFTHGQYFEGIEVKGFDETLVSVVTAAFRDAGLPGVKQLVQECQIRQDNPKYAHAMSRIYVTIGHLTAA
jgi:TIR domain